MTRENKLALVVGFGLILFVGILISDHFSVARNQASANLTNPRITDPLMPGPHTRNEPDLIALKPEPAPPTTAPLLQPGQPAVNPSTMASDTTGGQRQPIESMSPEQRSMINREVDVASRSAVAQNNSAPRSTRDVEPVPQNVQGNLTALNSRQSEPIRIEGFTPVPGGAESAVNIKDVRFHDVAQGESMFAICRQQYGDTSLAQALAKFNKMDDPAQLRAGRRLLIPPAETLGGKSKVQPNATPTSPAVASPTAVAANAPKPAAKAKTYTVKPGDSLSLIAQRLLGDKERWRDLQKLNRDVIDDPDNLRVGTVLRLSSADSSANLRGQRATPTAMFGKLLLIIVVVGAVACALLVIRQQRIDTFHEIAQVHVRLLDHERTLWQMREEIAERCRPSQVRLAMDELGLGWSPLPATPFDARQTEIRLASQQQTSPDPQPPSAKSSTPHKQSRARKPGA